MKPTTHHAEYLSLIEGFLSRNLDVAAFCSRFTTLWIQDRDDTYAKKAAWQHPYDELLLAEWQRGEINESEFQQKWAKLWGYANDIEFRTMVDKIHSACSVFSPSAELQWEIGEEELRQEVKETLAAYQRVYKPLARIA